MTRSAMACIGVVLFLAAPAWSTIINNDSLADVDSLSQDVMDAIGEQKWLFTHASVGGNIMAGLADLRTSNPTRYQLVGRTQSYNSSLLRASDPPTTTTAGVYDCNRSNPGWANKYAIFENSVRLGGWNSPTVDVVMDKLCYIDQAANVTTYLNMMTALEADYPDTVFVYTTIPLRSGTSGNDLRGQYNQAVRQHCQDNDRLLYDIADLEAHDAAGNEYTYEYAGVTYQQMYSGWTYDSGHLNAEGRVHVAKGWYAVAAAVVARNGSPCMPGDADCNGLVSLQDFVILKSNFGIKTGARWDQGDFDMDGDIDLEDFVILKQNFGNDYRTP